MPEVADDAAAQLDRFRRDVAPTDNVVQRPADSSEAAPRGRPANLVEGGAPKGGFEPLISALTGRRAWLLRSSCMGGQRTRHEREQTMHPAAG